MYCEGYEINEGEMGGTCSTHEKRNSIYLAEGKVQWQALVNTVVSLRVP
jgi:hypothetical protein